MSLNKLSYKTSSTYGLSIELFVEDKPVDSFIKSENEEIPYWIFKDDLPA